MGEKKMGKIGRTTTSTRNASGGGGGGAGRGVACCRTKKQSASSRAKAQTIDKKHPTAPRKEVLETS